MKPGCYLVDTGALVALLDRNDPAHPMVKSRWVPLIGDFITTGAVLTETLHFLQPINGGARAIAGLVEQGMILVDDAFGAGALEGAVALMERYHDTPMDFADATLVLTAERRKIADILTLDERGFRTYRFAGKRRFHLVLQDGGSQ